MTPGLVTRHDGAAWVFLPAWTARDMFAAFQLLLDEGIVRAVPAGYELSWSMNAPILLDPLNQHGRLLVRLVRAQAAGMKQPHIPPDLGEYFDCQLYEKIHGINETWLKNQAKIPGPFWRIENAIPPEAKPENAGFRAAEDRFLVDLYTKLIALLEAARSKDKAPE